MEINNGARTTVRYFAQGLSPGESSTLRDLERAENETAYVQDLQELKRQYVFDDSILQANRRAVQLELYGTSITTSSFANLTTAIPFAPYNYPYPAGFGYGLGYGYGAGLGYGGGYGLGLGQERTVSRSLEFGVGDEGVLKANIARTVADQAKPEFASAVERSLDRAVAQAGSSRALRASLDLPYPGSYGRPVAADLSTGVTVVLKDGERIAGTRLEEGKDWTTIHTAEGKVRVRPTEVMRVYEGKSGTGVRPATD
jgi:hypothetical protein